MSILNSLIILELKPYDDSGQYFNQQRYDSMKIEKNLGLLRTECLNLENIVKNFKQRFGYLL
jgi:hypothetical protein